MSNAGMTNEQILQAHEDAYAMYVKKTGAIFPDNYKKLLSFARRLAKDNTNLRKALSDAHVPTEGETL